MVNSVQFAKRIASFMLAFVFLTASVSAAEVAAQLDRESVPAGNGAILTVKISGGRGGRPTIPEVENLIFQSRGESTQMQMSNGQITHAVTYRYAVGSHTPGDYRIPAIDVMVDGKKLTTQPLKLKVLDSGAAQIPPGNPPAAPGPQPAAEAEESGEERFGFLTVELADHKRQHVYVGEIAPVRIRAWLPEGARVGLRGGIQPEGKGFTLHNVSERPQETQEMRDGKRYNVITWFGGISASKAGNYPASLSLNATVAVRDSTAPKPQRRRMGGPFDDPFFDNVFDQMNVPMVQKDVTLQSDDQGFEVRPLPAEGKPEGFTGAVGNFKFEGTQIPNLWKTGEPQQIGARLSGSGNFALMRAPELTPAGALKSYPGKDEFTAGDQASFSGSKEFQFSALSRKSGDLEVALTFSYFDPAAESYQTITSPPQKIQVTGSDIIDTEPAATLPAIEPEKKIASLIPQRLELSPRALLVPLVSRPVFIPLLVLAGLLCVVGKILASLRIRRSDPHRIAFAATEKATAEALETAGKCAAAHDVSGYFAAARLALQHRLGARWNQPPQAITLAEITARIPADSPVTRFFAEADRHEYNREANGEILSEWRSLLDDALSSLTPATR